MDMEPLVGYFLAVDTYGDGTVEVDEFFAQVDADAAMGGGGEFAVEDHLYAPSRVGKCRGVANGINL